MCRYIFVYSLVDRSSLDPLYGFIDLLEQVSDRIVLEWGGKGGVVWWSIGYWTWRCLCMV